MMPESGPEDMLILEEQVGPVPSAPARRGAPTPVRIAGMVLGGLALGLAATTIAIRLANRGRGSMGRRRAPLFSFQPRAAIFAPSITITLPFSGVSGQAVPGRRRPVAVRTLGFPRRGRPMRARRPSQPAREMDGSRRRLSRSARRAVAR